METDAIIQSILDQVMSVFQSGTINIMIVLGMTVFTQIIKMNVHWISKRILLFPIFLASAQTAFSYFVTRIEIIMLPIIWFGYLAGTVLAYVLLKKWKRTSKFFKSNYNFLKEKENERKEKNAAKKKKK